MGKLIHMWVDDNINRGLLDNNYTEIVEYRRGDGNLVKIDCLYQGYNASVYFYTSEQLYKGCSALLGGIECQKVTINAHVTEESLLFLWTRMRSQTLPREGVYPTEEKFVMEIGDGWKILDAHKGGNHREFKSFKGVTCAGEFLGLVEGLGCPLDKRVDM